ncbi:MAG: hypothetical protein ACO1RA_02420 [Planctomycetaceae bacterium]
MSQSSRTQELYDNLVSFEKAQKALENKVSGDSIHWKSIEGDDRLSKQLLLDVISDGLRVAIHETTDHLNRALENLGIPVVCAAQPVVDDT